MCALKGDVGVSVYLFLFLCMCVRMIDEVVHLH